MNQDEIKFLEEFQKKYLTENSDKIDLDEIYNQFGIDMNKLEEEMTEVKPEKLKLDYKKLHQDAVDPFYNYLSDSGFDLYSVEEVTIPPLGRALISTGLSFDIPDTFEIQVRSKSGLAINQGLMCLNSPGTVDSGYLGEIKVILFNTNQESVIIKKNMKVAQAVIARVANGNWVDFVKKENLSQKDRGQNGFGSTGI
jgi:dUTP pyrophosphatase